MDFLKSFLSFDRMVAVPVIKIVYFLGIALIVLSGLATFFGSLSGYGSSALGALGALVGMAFGLLLWRLMCEMWIVIFGIYDRLGLLVKQGGKTDEAPLDTASGGTTDPATGA